MKRFLAAVMAAALLLTAAGCGRQEQQTQAQSKYLMAMDTVMELTVYGDRAQEGLEQVSALITGLEDELSVTDPESTVAALNESGELTVTSPHLAALLDLALLLGERTGGALDVTVYPVVKAWGFTGEEYRVPGEAELAELLGKVDWSAVQWDGESVLLPDGAQVDFGSLAKGYAGEEAADLLRELGVTSALLNLGGNVQTVGSKPDGSAWRIAIKDPNNTSAQLGIVELRDQAVVTSGGYERYFEQNGETYWHIIDPETGCPADSGLISVTIVGESGALCDGLSTALFILGKEAALDYWRQWGGFEAVLVGADGVVTVTAGLADCFQLTGAGYTLEIAEG